MPGSDICTATNYIHIEKHATYFVATILTVPALPRLRRQCDPARCGLRAAANSDRAVHRCDHIGIEAMWPGSWTRFAFDGRREFERYWIRSRMGAPETGCSFDFSTPGFAQSCAYEDATVSGEKEG